MADYQISIIVPAYNAEEYMAACLDSLLHQTIEKTAMQVIVIDDESTDRTPEILRSYSEKYPFIEVYRKQNAGVSAARNDGIRRAKGKYIMYLDSDDTLTPPSVENIVSFFDSVYDTVDLVTYFIQPYIGNELLKTHARYKNFLTHTGVYDLEQNPYIVQTTMNVCVKNLGEKNFLFNEQMHYQEDQEYINRVLKDKLKLGYCSHACYMYNRSNDASSMASRSHAYFLFESTMQYFESLFAQFPEKVPRYYQAVFFHDLRWKLMEKILYPFHYDDEAFAHAMDRIKALLARVDTEIIAQNPSILKPHVHYWLNLKPNVFPLPYVSRDGIDVLADGKTIGHAKQATLKITKIEQVDGGLLRLRAYSGIGVFNYMKEEPKFFLIRNETEKQQLKLYPSKFGYYKTNIMTNRFYGFDVLIDPKETHEISFKCSLDSYSFDVKINFSPAAVFRRKTRQFSYARGNVILSYYNNTIRFRLADKEEIYRFEKDNIALFNPERAIAELKNEALDYRHDHRVWLYSDLNSVKKDNAYAQFVHDFEKDDGVERYYIYTRPYEEIEALFTDAQKARLVEFGSPKHRMLYLASELILSSFFGREAISPFFDEQEESNYYDIEHFRIIYMQHGILHAHYVNKYSAENALCDKVVVSSYFELENLTENYCFKKDDLIPCGMPRYEFIDKTKKAQNKVLFAPSWRSYLARNVTPTTYSISMPAFRKSDYYQNFAAFLNDERLHALLQQHDLTLDVKMHPIITQYATELFPLKSERVKLVSGDVDLSDYKAFITDFSSFVFDFAYLCRPVLYFVPDYAQFRSGMNLYRKLDLEFEDAFGELATDPQKAIDAFARICKADFVPAAPFKERMEKFYLPMQHCRADIYNYITTKMF